MARVFWVTCPKCSDKFEAHWDELRHNKTIPLLCPYCGKRFFDYTTGARSNGFEPNFRWTKPSITIGVRTISSPVSPSGRSRPSSSTTRISARRTSGSG